MLTNAEINFDGLIGPTHNYGGLSLGNNASQDNSKQVSSPKDAALQGLKKMKLLMEESIPQGIFLPHERPHLKGFSKLGFTGNIEKVLNDAYAVNPNLVSCFYSASSMWAANAATFSPSMDNIDNAIHITVANLNSMMHRSIEPKFTYKMLKRIFNKKVNINKSLLNLPNIGDEGAANHIRIAERHNVPGYQIFVYSSENISHAKTIERQSLIGSKLIARKNCVKDQRVFYLQQSNKAIRYGCFHNDIVSTANENIFIYHEEAFESTQELKVILAKLKKLVPNFKPIKILNSEIDLQTIISSYLLNSQLISLPSGGMMFLLPSEVKQYPNCMQWLEKISAEEEIKKIKFIDVKQSMRNGGGPACLRLRMIFNENEISSVNKNFLLDDNKIDLLTNLIENKYRDRLQPDDLLDPNLADESLEILDALTKIFKTGSIYNFQKI